MVAFCGLLSLADAPGPALARPPKATQLSCQCRLSLLSLWPVLAVCANHTCAGTELNCMRGCFMTARDAGIRGPVGKRCGPPNDMHEGAPEICHSESSLANHMRSSRRPSRTRSRGPSKWASAEHTPPSHPLPCPCDGISYKLANYPRPPRGQSRRGAPGGFTTFHAGQTDLTSTMQPWGSFVM